MASSEDDVKSVSIAGRVVSERERLIGMTDDERAWRSRYLKSQVLAPDEPVIPKGYYEEYHNPLRRLFRAPMNVVENALTGVVSKPSAYVLRNILGGIGKGIVLIYCGCYYFKYNTATWMSQSSWSVVTSRLPVYPSDKGYPNYKIKKASEYGTRGFENSPI
ncbi:uncharacterized protein LOC122403604 [Colletes gigas]|uniref:uncharacterized protein LOC122403604 n=1 Tax=Colletes gigas TaxID=935657 RepID=UPI001C9B1228|nr:uncharacterized protein LOC122403604 [Colletes gigas]